MALKAGYHGIKKNLYDLVSKYGIFTRTEQDVLGAKNLLHLLSYKNNVTGITATVGDDGTITIDGTATAANNLYFSSRLDANAVKLKKGDYILTVGTDLPANSKLEVSYTNAGGSNVVVADGAKGSGTLKFTAPADDRPWNIVIIFGANDSVNNLKLYPMIRLATDPDDTYEPYAMTNQELTKNVFAKARELSNTNDLNDVVETGLYCATTTPANTPENKNYFTLLVNRRTAGDIKQIIFKDGFMYARSYGGSPSAWSNWYKYTGSQITPSTLTSTSPETRSEEPELTEDEPIVKKTTKKATKKTEEV